MYSKAISDYYASFARYWLWSTIAWFDIKVRYKRSVLGPFWITLSTGIAIATIGPIYARLMGSPINDFFPYLATSIILWGFISESIKDNCIAFIGAEDSLKAMKLPFVMFIVKEIYKNSILVVHNFAIIGVLMFFFTFKMNIPLFLLCWVVIILNIFWISIAVAVLCARFRDVTQIVTSIVQVAFFLTPIMWEYDRFLSNKRGIGRLVVELNPFYYMIDIFRTPLLSGTVDIRNFTICLSMAIIGNIFAFWLFARKRDCITYWL